MMFEVVTQEATTMVGITQAMEAPVARAPVEGILIRSLTPTA